MTRRVPTNIPTCVAFDGQTRWINLCDEYCPVWLLPRSFCFRSDHNVEFGWLCSVLTDRPAHLAGDLRLITSSHHPLHSAIYFVSLELPTYVCPYPVLGTEQVGIPPSSTSLRLHLHPPRSLAPPPTYLPLPPQHYRSYNNNSTS